MHKSAVLLLVLVLLMVSFAATTEHAEAQFLGRVYIKADGTIEPVDAPIQRVGDTYTLTGDVGRISVMRNNIILDGNGHTLPGKVTSFNEILGINVTTHNAGGVDMGSVQNVVVKNLIIKDCQIGIYLGGCFNVTVSGNIITGTYVPVPQAQATGGIYLWGGMGNTITGNQLAKNYNGIVLGYHSWQNTVTRNNITNNNSRGIVASSISDNVLYENNFVDNAVQAFASGDRVNSWDNGSVGNYWNDYNGTDSDGDGIGDTPYVIDANNQDNYPLMMPYKEPEPTPEPQEAEPFPATLIVAASVVIVSVVGAALLVYFKRRKR